MIKSQLLEIRRFTLILSGFLLIGCSTSGPIPEIAPQFTLNAVQVELYKFSKMKIELEDPRWDELNAYQRPVVFSYHHGWGWPRCQPAFKVLATLAAPPRHPFIQGNPGKANGMRYDYLARRPTGLSFIRMDLAPVSLDELEKEFIRSALPRSRWKQPAEPPFCGSVY